MPEVGSWAASLAVYVLERIIMAIVNNDTVTFLAPDVRGDRMARFLSWRMAF